MSMEETKELRMLYSFFQALVYATVLIEIMVFVNFNFGKATPVMARFGSLPIYANIFYSKLFTFLLIIVTSIGTRAQKKIDLNPGKHIAIPLFFGFIAFFGSALLLLYRQPGDHWREWYYLAYMGGSILGAILANIALDNISKRIKSGLLKDRFNIENESFEQTREKIENDYSVNIPMRFLYKKKWNNGWLNIASVFRGALLIGTPGSGKSYTVINSYIRQHSRKKFTLCVYDFKYPDLARLCYYLFQDNKRRGIIGEKWTFNMINFSNVEYSRRVNPFKRSYLEKLSDAIETSEALYESLQKGDRVGSNEHFFKTAAVNFGAAVIYFFSRYKNGIYSDPPHVLAFMNRDYDEIFKVLFSNPELQSLLSPFRTAYDNKAFDQLEGMIGSLKVQLSRLATIESFWVFSGDDFDLKISDPKNPAYLVITNNPQEQNINSALNALILNRLTSLVNSRGNLPVSIIVDECPTLYFHRIANLVSTARSNKVSVLLGVQEIPQLEEIYGKAVTKTITSVIGNILSGSARQKETLEWLQTLFGKVKQRKDGVQINRDRTTINMNEQMDYLIPASKIAALTTGDLVGQIAADYGQDKDYVSTFYHCRTNLDVKAIEKEEALHKNPPKYYNFGGVQRREAILQQNFKRIYDEVDAVVREYV